MRWDVGSGAELKLYGQKPNGRMWSRMRHTAQADEHVIFLMGQLDFRVGDLLIIAGTGDGKGQTEYSTVVDVGTVPTQVGGFDTRITLQAGLRYKHIGVVEVHGNKRLEMRAEVGIASGFTAVFFAAKPPPCLAPQVALYHRPSAVLAPAITELVHKFGDYSTIPFPIQRSSFIRIGGVQDNGLNVNFRFRWDIFFGLILSTSRGSVTVLSGVHVTDIGKYGHRRSKSQPGVACGGSCDIRSSLFHPRQGDGINTGGELPSHVENIVMVHHNRGVAVSSRTALVDSAFINARTGDTAMNAGAIVGLCSARSTIKGNAVAGGALGWSSGCYGMSAALIANNTIHSMRVGMAIKGNLNTKVAGIPGNGVVLWKISRIAVWLYTTSREPSIGGGIVIADANIGLQWSNVGPNPVAHTLARQRLTVLDATFIGRSYSNANCRDRVRAILLPVSTTEGPSIAPGICGDLGGSHANGVWGVKRSIGSYPTLLAETRVTESTFLRYIPSICTDWAGRPYSATVLETFQEGGQDSSDGVPPLFFHGTTIDAGSRTNLANLKPPKRSWIVPSRCGVMDCDGPKQVMIHDLDGALTGNGPGSSILARSELMNERRANGKDTWYNLPTKM